jgi:hypothetical protein
MTEELFLVKLARGLEFYKTNLDTTAIPKLKQAASILHSSFKNIYQFCLEKKMLSTDQYGDDIAVNEIKAPSSEPFIESEKKIEMSIRIAAYSKQLEYLNTSFSFNIENINLSAIKNLSDLISYIDWATFSENSAKPITRVLAAMVGTVKLGSDQMQAKVIKNDIKRLREESINFKEALKAIALFRKEQYKAELRKRIAFAGVIDFREDIKEDIEKNIRSMMKREMNNTPFYSALVAQLIDDEKTAPSSWEKLLKLLSPTEKKTVKTKSLDKNELLKIIQELGKNSLLLNKILKKFDENTIVLNRKKRNLIEKIAFMLSETFNKNKKIVYEIEEYNAEHTVKKNVTLNYIKFSDDLKGNAHKIYLMSTPENLKKLIEEDDEELLIKINNSLDVFKRSFRKLTALDTYFKEKAPKHVKSDISGIKVELNGIKLSLANTQKKRNEYISQKEEIDQLKKLGIQIEQT